MPVKKNDSGKSREVAARLEEQILRTGLRAGWRLPSEEQLCRMNGVSRTVVREAMQRLKAGGLVESRRGGGSFVAEIDESVIGRAVSAYAALSPTSEAFARALDLRALIHGACARGATARKDKEVVARLRSRLEALKRARDNAEVFADADAGFCRQLAEDSGNVLYVEMYGAIAAVIAAFSRTALAPQDRRDRAIADHDALFEAVRTGNAGAAEALAVAHANREKADLIEARVRARE
jgi:GntR family transcriptional repressor for pyruvate dehydrogenase complex